MKVLVINGSPRVNGNTSAAIDEMVMGKEKFGIPDREAPVATNYIR